MGQRRGLFPRQLLRKLPRSCHVILFLASSWLELRHSLATGAVGSVIFILEPFSAKVLGSVVVEVYQGTASCLCHGGLAVGLAFQGEVRAGCWAHLPQRLHFFLQEWTIRLSWQSSLYWMAKEQSPIQQARVSTPPLLSSHWVSICSGSPMGGVNGSP